MRMAREKHNADYRRAPKITDMAVQCWCRLEIVHVPQEVIARCETETCGRPTCHAPED